MANMFFASNTLYMLAADNLIYRGQESADWSKELQKFNIYKMHSNFNLEF